MLKNFYKISNPLKKKNFKSKSGNSAPSAKIISTAGFTLVELIVSVSIITIFALVLLVKHNQFGGTVALNNLAYETGLAIRQAQVFGISVREQESGDFDYAYGVGFHRNAPTQIISFIDIDGDGVWVNDTNDPGELIETYNITKGNIIADLCILTGSTERCGSTGDLDSIHITFLRPDPEPNIKTSPNFSSISEARIYLRSPRGLEKVVTANNTGQISIE